MPKSNTQRILVYVQHLLGIGHLQRALQLAQALARQSFEVELVSGGQPHSMIARHDFPVHQLPALRSADGSFKTLLDENDEPIDDAWRERRKLQLLELFRRFNPQVLITETFPFGRRMLRHELLPLLEAARDSSDCRLVVSSIRDILQPRSNPERIAETLGYFDEFYDRVIVHGDERVAGLGDSFAAADRLDTKVGYSGYLCTRVVETRSKDGYDEVLVSAGGSATGLDILRTAIAAKPLSVFARDRWRLLVSPAIPEHDFDKLRRTADDGVIVERNRPDFGALMHRAKLSISQAGYNTMTDLLQTDTASVVIPFAEAAEIEQSLRAAALQRLGRVVTLAQADMTAETLAQALAQAREHCRPLQLNLDGAAQSARMIGQWLADPESRA